MSKRFAVSVPTITRWLRLKRETGGLTPKLNFCQQNPVAGLDRIFNTSVTYYKAVNGKFKMLSPGFHDMLPNYRKATGK